MVTQIQQSRHAIKEGHGKQLYCVAWSSDSFTESSTSDNNVVMNSKFTNGDEKDPDHVTDHNIESEEASKENENQKNSQEFNDNLIHDTDSTDTAIYHCFATCGSYYLTIYQMDTFNRNSTMQVKQIYKDSDYGEIYYACVFAGRCKRLDKDICDGSKKMLNGEIDIDASNISSDSYIYQEIDDKNMGKCPQLCLVGGKRGTIKVIDTIQQSLVTTLTGHCDEVYDLKVCPTDEWLFLSAANDETIRLWNLKTPACIAIFAGHKGHRDAILSLDWHPSGDCFASGGFDQTVKVWSCKHNEIQKSIRDSFSTKDTTRFPTVIQQFPIFNTSKMHSDYGKSFLSKISKL
jgi:WD40 repeat protein